MKKIIIVIFVVIIVVLCIEIFYKNNEKNFNIDIQKLAQELSETHIFEDNLNEVDKNITLKKWNLDSKKIKNIISYVGSGATSEEILIIELFDDKDVKEIKKNIESKLEERKQDFQNYLPKEVFKLENYNLKIKGNYIILCVSNNSDKAEEVINKYIKS